MHENIMALLLSCHGYHHSHPGIYFMIHPAAGSNRCAFPGQNAAIPKEYDIYHL
jgi:hypothetical protein